MKWPEEKIEQLKKLCFEERPNVEIARILGFDIKEIHAAQPRSRLGITMAKVKAAKAAKAAKLESTSKMRKTPRLATAAAEDTPVTLWKKPIAKAFDQLDKALIDAAEIDPDNWQVLRQVAAGVTIYKALLLNSVE